MSVSKKATTIVSLAEAIELLKEKITNYFKQYDQEDHWATFPTQAYFSQLLKDMFNGDTSTSPAQRMIATEVSNSAKYLVDAGISPNTAVIIELVIFRHVVNLLSSTIENMCFGDNTLTFEVRGLDVYVGNHEINEG